MTPEALIDCFDEVAVAVRKAVTPIDVATRRARTKVAGQYALDVIAEHGSLDRYLWSFVDGSPMVNHWQTSKDVPAKTELSDRMSKALAKRGFRFVGSTICYAFMQATGMVNDHLVSCFRYKESGHAEH